MMEKDRGYFDGFMDDLRNGRYGSGEDFDKAAVRRRAMMYIQKARATANRAFVDASGDMEFDWVLGGTEDHCATCPIYAENSPYRASELPAMPADGTTECLTNCLCVLVRDDGLKGFSRVDDP